MMKSPTTLQNAIVTCRTVICRSIHAKTQPIGIAAILLLLGLGGAASLHGQTVGTIMPSPFLTVLDNNGAIVNAGCVWTYSAGTSTPVTTWTDSAMAVPNANPIIADSAGRFTAYLLPGNSYKFAYENVPCSAGAHGTVLRTPDNITAVPSGQSSVTLTGTAGQNLTAGNAVYLSDGSGSKTAGRWYPADTGNTYSSTLPWVGIAQASITSGSTGTIIIAGSVTGLTSLTTGAAYYVSTAGAITSTTPGSNARKIGQADTTTSLVLSADPPITGNAGLGTGSASVETFLRGDLAWAVASAQVCQGRLTLTSGTAVTTGDVTGATSIYFTPYTGNRCATYNGTNWTLNTFTEITLALGTLVTATNYDVFLTDSTLVLSATAWTSDTARATNITLQNGVYVKSGTTTQRYLGTFRTTSTTATEDSAAKRFVWNMYNRVPRSLKVVEATASWTYTTATWRQARATTTNQIDLVQGVAEQALTVQAIGGAANPNGNIFFNVGIQQDGTTTPDAAGTQQTSNNTSGADQRQITVTNVYQVAVGRHYFVWLEASTAGTGTTTWYGTNATVGGNSTNSGIFGFGWLA